MTTPRFPEPAFHDGQVVVGTGPDGFRIDVDETFKITVFVERESRAADDPAAIIVLEGFEDDVRGEPNTVALRLDRYGLGALLATIKQLHAALDDEQAA